MIDSSRVKIEEKVLLEKFDGEPSPETLVEKVWIVDGKIVKQEFYDGADNKIDEIIFEDQGGE